MSQPKTEWPPKLDSVPPGVKGIRAYRNGSDLVECHHDMSYRVTFASGGGMCGFCKASPSSTDGFARPVKMLVVMPEVAALF